MAIFKDKNGNVLSLNEAYPRILNRFYNVWLDFKLMLLRWIGHVPSHSVRGYLYQMAGIKLGKGAVIHMWANFFEPKNIIIGKDTIIGDHAFLDGRAALKIGNHVDIASSVMIFNSEHDLRDNNFKAILEPVRIEDYVFIKLFRKPEVS